MTKGPGCPGDQGRTVDGYGAVGATVCSGRWMMAEITAADELQKAEELMEWGVISEQESTFTRSSDCSSEVTGRLRFRRRVKTFASERR